jgi:hypothetical protein
MGQMRTILQQKIPTSALTDRKSNFKFGFLGGADEAVKEMGFFRKTFDLMKELKK